MNIIGGKIIISFLFIITWILLYTSEVIVGVWFSLVIRIMDTREEIISCNNRRVVCWFERLPCSQWYS